MFKKILICAAALIGTIIVSQMLLGGLAGGIAVMMGGYVTDFMLGAATVLSYLTSIVVTIIVAKKVF